MTYNKINQLSIPVIPALTAMDLSNATTKTALFFLTASLVETALSSSST